MTKVINYILSIDTFEQQFVAIKVMLQITHFKYHMKTIRIEKPASNGPTIEHKCLNNTKKIYQHAGKCDEQKKFKDIIEADMFYTTEEITENSPSLPMTQTTNNKPSAGK